MVFAIFPISDNTGEKILACNLHKWHRSDAEWRPSEDLPVIVRRLLPKRNFLEPARPRITAGHRPNI